MSILLYSADTALARPDIGSFSDQTLLENFLEQCSAWTREHFQDADGNYIDFCSKAGFGIKCDPDGTITAIEWDDILEGDGVISLNALPPNLTILELSNAGAKLFIDIQKLPQGLTNFFIIDDPVDGEVYIADLPPKMEHFGLNFCSARGTIDCASWQPPLKFMKLQNNRLYGEIRLDKLPHTLLSLELHCNAFSGKVSLSALPPALEKLNISGNCLCGQLDLSSLPGKLSTLILSKNDFEGEIVAHSFPASLRHLMLERLPELSGTVLVSKDAKTSVYLKGSPITRTWID